MALDEERSSATARRMLVGARLKRMREARGISRETAGFTIRASESKMSRLELGKVSFKDRDVADLLVLYGIKDPDERDEIVRMAQQASQPGWWRAYEDVLPGWFDSYVGLEEAAATIRTYEIQFIPGLFQTPEYVRAVIEAALPPPAPHEVDRAVDLRLARQRLLDRAQAPHIWAVIDEAALRRPIGSPAVVKGQLVHLLDLTDRPHLTLQVVPTHSGAHAVAGGAFTLLRFGDLELPDTVYLEQLLNAVYVDRPEHVERYAALMDRLSAEALTPQDTIGLLHDLVADS
ncbi:MAG: helix-turn-helix domain-containing protein [Nocardioides sp.]